jgi:hypothetical protein
MHSTDQGRAPGRFLTCSNSFRIASTQVECVLGMIRDACWTNLTAAAASNW